MLLARLSTPERERLHALCYQLRGHASYPLRSIEAAWPISTPAVSADAGNDEAERATGLLLAFLRDALFNDEASLAAVYVGVHFERFLALLVEQATRPTAGPEPSPFIYPMQ